MRIFYNLSERLKRVAVVVVPEYNHEQVDLSFSFSERIRRLAASATRALRDVGATHVLIEPLANDMRGARARTAVRRAARAPGSRQ